MSTTDNITLNPRQHLEALQKQRTNLSILIQTLSSVPNVSSSEFVDSEGFPLPDANLEVLRESRRRQKQLDEAQNDYKRVMREIEALLPFAFEKNIDEPVVREQERKCQPFALVTNVVKDMSAYNAGIRVGDEIYRFGGLRNVSFISDNELINAIKGQQTMHDRVIVSVNRGGEGTFSTSVKCGNGSLGMHLKTITKIQ